MPSRVSAYVERVFSWFSIIRCYFSISNFTWNHLTCTYEIMPYLFFFNLLVHFLSLQTTAWGTGMRAHLSTHVLSSRIHPPKWNCWSVETALSQFYVFSTIFFVCRQPKILVKCWSFDHLTRIKYQITGAFPRLPVRLILFPELTGPPCVFNIKSKKGPSWCRETWQLRDRVFSGQHGWRRDDQEGFRVCCSLNKLKSRCYERREAPLQRELNKKGVVLSMIEIANGKRFAKSIWPLPISGEIITLFQQDLGLPSWWKECSRLYHAPRMQEEWEVQSSSFSSGSA